LAWFVVGAVSPLHAGLLFEDDTPLELVLTGPLWSLVENKEDRNEWPFRLSANGLEIDLQLKARGNSRLRVCSFPPLRFNFKKADTVGTLFEGQDKLKLVTRCRNSRSSEADVLEEYAAYRIFGMLSDVGFRVRLVHITYNDTDGRITDKERTSYGFLIEPLRQLASRNGGRLSEIPAISRNWINEEQAALVYIFQYLIGNTDWSLVTAESEENCCHNIELIKIDSKQFIVPYDFDLAGIVSASYAKPDPSLRIRSVKVRRYRGFCTEPGVLPEALSAITSREDEILGIFADLPFLTEKEKARSIDYLEGFFKKAANGEKLISLFERKCHR
jgi:hypothetical protein